MSTIEVPTIWVVMSCVYFLLSIVWSIVLVAGAIIVWKKLSPLLTEAQTQVRRVSGQAKSVAAKASSTVDIVHAQTQNLLGTAQSAGTQVTRQARTVGAALTGLLVAARVVNFVRRVL